MTAQLKISSKATIGKNVHIGDFTTVFENVEIGDNTTIESNCIIGYHNESAQGKPLIISENSYIRSHSIFYEGSKFGPGLVSGHGVLARENCRAGKRFQIGTNSILDGDSTFGDYVRIHSSVIISKQTVIGDFVFIYPSVIILNDPFPPSPLLEKVMINDLAVIAPYSVIYPGVTIGTGGFVAAGSHVKLDVPDAHCVAGSPAKVFATLDKFIHPKYGLYHPWIKRDIDKYPKEAHSFIEEKISKLEAVINKTRLPK